MLWKTTFDGRQPSMEDDLQWKTTVNGEISRFRSAIYRRCGNFFSILLISSFPSFFHTCFPPYFFLLLDTLPFFVCQLLHNIIIIVYRVTLTAPPVLIICWIINPFSLLALLISFFFLFCFFSFFLLYFSASSLFLLSIVQLGLGVN